MKKYDRKTLEELITEAKISADQDLKLIAYSALQALEGRKIAEGLGFGEDPDSLDPQQLNAVLKAYLTAYLENPEQTLMTHAGDSGARMLGSLLLFDWHDRLTERLYECRILIHGGRIVVQADKDGARRFYDPYKAASDYLRRYVRARRKLFSADRIPDLKMDHPEKLGEILQKASDLY